MPQKQGHGPCSRRLVGTPFRRVVIREAPDGTTYGYHVTEGTVHDPETLPSKSMGGELPPGINPFAQIAREIRRTDATKRNMPRASVPGGLRRLFNKLEAAL